jgi:uncharacterized repeat protein (TIGR03803 family)
MKPVLACVAFFAYAVSGFAQTPAAPPITQLFTFYCEHSYSYCPRGFQPALGPVQLSDGNFYGTTWYGDTNASAGGTVWQATLSGDVHALYTFTANGSGDYVDGSAPAIGLAAGANGNLYGITETGGAQDSGVFYSLTTGGSQQVLYNFCSLAGCADKAAPIVLGGDGNFYGITTSLVFRLTPEGVWSEIYNFNFPSTNEGVELIAGTDGNLYGISFSHPFQTIAQASVFRLTTAGVYTALHTFPKLDRVSALTQSASGTLYGVFSGTKSGIFQINSAGQFKVLQNTAKGAFPPTQLVVGSDGNLYGLIVNSSAYPPYPGSVFAVSAQGKTIFSEELNCATVGCQPLSLMEANDGNFYGLTPVGGTAPHGDTPNGTIFKVATGLKGR